MTRVVSVRDLRLRRGTRDILNGVTFDVAPGEIVALMGLSGSGKTTILRVIAGLEGAELLTSTLGARGAGDAAVAEASLPAVALTGRVGMVFQFHFLFEHLTTLDNVCLAPVHVHHVSREAAETRARTLL